VGRDDLIEVPCGVLADQADALNDAHGRLSACQRELDDLQGRFNERGEALTRCERARQKLTLKLGELSVPEPKRSPWWLRAGLDVAIGVTWGGATALLLSDVPEGLRWSSVAVAAGILGTRLIVQVVDDS
jgi:hypothetical protein